VPLIVLEGPEGAGKTTQVAKLAEWLMGKGKQALSLREPGGTPLGDEVRRLLLDPASEVSARAEAMLFMASRAQLVETRIRPALAKGFIVLLDRFYLSTYAYQIRGRGLDEAMIVSANKLAIGDLRPDVTLWLSMPVEDGLSRAAKRGQADRMERADAAFHDRVAEAFRDFSSRKWQAKHPYAGPVIEVDASGTVDAVHERVLAALRSTLPGLLR
jgi:dTMP kinase